MLFLCTIGLIGFFLLQNSSREIIYSSEQKLIHSSDLIKLEFSKYIENLRYDITHISNSPYIHDFFDNPSEDSRLLLAYEYLSLLKSKPYYSQIRYIGAKQNGQEIVRVERDSSGTEKILSVLQLQNKSDREYYIETIKLPESVIYLSDIDLNKEYGKISYPIAPTLRIACPVYHNNVLEGIIVINTALTELFKSLERITDSATKMIIVNEGGYYLYSENEADNFGFEFGKPSAFIDDFHVGPYELSLTEKSIFNIGDYLYLIKSLDFKEGTADIYLLSYANKNTLLKSYYSWRNTSFLIIFLLGLLSFAIAFLYMNRQAKALKTIANKIKSYPTSTEKIKLTTTRKDEIGDLVDSFNQMSSIINTNISLLTEANKTAENAIIEKEEFIENMSHEIRNPLQSIIGLAHLMESEDLSAHQRKILEGLKFNTHNLQVLVNEILEFKNVQRNAEQIELSWINIHQFANQIQTSNNQAVLRKNISFMTHIDASLVGYSMKCDLTKLTQIVGNLISNAIKFTNEGGQIQLKIEKLVRASTADYSVRISIKDNGIGINEAVANQVTNRYFTKNNQPSFSKGFGLGLSITVKLLSTLNSKLNIESKEGFGSVFWFDIDTQLDKITQRADDKLDQFNSLILKNLEVVIVEDDPQILDIYAHLFNDKVKSITYIDNLDQFTNCNLNTCDILILDYYLNSISLLDYFSDTKISEATYSAMFIISGKTIDKSKLPERLRQSTAILKPFKPEEVLEMVIYKFLENKYGRPILDSIKADYDFNKEIYTNALNLLISEWVKIEPELRLGILNEDLDSIASIRHKIITTARRLKLSKFEKMLESIEKDIAQYGHLATASKISLAMQYFVRSINVAKN